MSYNITTERLSAGYSQLFEAYTYNVPYMKRLLQFKDTIGTVYLSLFIGGAILLKKHKKIRNFLIFIISNILIIHFTFNKTQVYGTHHILLIAPSILVIICVSNYYLFQRVYFNWLRNIIPIIIIFVSILSFCYVILDLKLTNKLLLGILPNNIYRPLIRSDIDELYRAVDKILEINKNNEYVYVLASSGVFNDSILRNAIRIRSKNSFLRKKIYYSSTTLVQYS